MTAVSQPVVMDSACISALAESFRSVKISGDGPPVPPWGAAPTLEAFQQSIEIGRHHLPLPYESAFVAPLEKQLERVLKHTLQEAKISGSEKTGLEPAETIFGALYAYGDDSQVQEQIHRFGAVVSTLFDTFLSREKRNGLNLPITERLAPLPAFKHEGLGPFTLPVDYLEQVIGAKISIVSLPSAYRNDPLLWTSLAHEVGGHDVTHATPGLLDELRCAIRHWFHQASFRFLSNGSPEMAEHAQQLGEVWSAWADEASADVCGVLNLGPTFGLTFAAWLAALRAALLKQDKPQLLTMSTSPPGAPLDPHPVDWLRPWIALGATRALFGLAPDRLAIYSEPLARYLHENGSPDGASNSSPPEFIGIAGTLTPPGGRELSIELPIPAPLAAQIAVEMGRLIATTPLRSLGGLSLAQLESWNEADETVAQRIAARLTGGQPVGRGHDATHLLAGGSIAVLQTPENYQSVTDALNRELSELAHRHPRKTPFQPHRPISGLRRAADDNGRAASSPRSE